MWHTIIALGLHIWLDNVCIAMPACPLGSTYVRTTSNMACHYHPWTAYTVRQHWVWPVIISLEHITWSDNVEHGMPSWSSGSTHARKTSGVAEVERQYREWHVVIAVGQHPLLDDVRCGMITRSLRKTHDRTALIVACHHHHWTSTTIIQRLAWHAIIALGKRTRSNSVEHV